MIHREMNQQTETSDFYFFFKEIRKLTMRLADKVHGTPMILECATFEHQKL